MNIFTNIADIEAAAKADRYGDYVYAMMDHGALAVRHFVRDIDWRTSEDPADVFIYQFAPPKTISYFPITVTEAEEFFEGLAPVKG